MIIKYPTGLYRDQLNYFLTTTNVTYNISGNTPNRSNILFIQLPLGEKLRVSEIPLERNRANLGDLIFTVSTSKNDKSQSSQRLFETGTILEFDAPESVLTPSEIGVSASEISHNLFYLDYDRLGFNNQDVGVINDAVNVSFDIKTQRLNDLKKSYSNTYTNVQNISRSNNEIKKAIGALELANETGALTDYINKLKNDIITGQEQLAAASASLEVLSAEIIRENDALRSLGALVK